MVEKVLAIVKKVLDWLTTDFAGVLGIIQAVIKVGKEITTACVNILCPVLGDNFDKVVYKIRDVFNKADEVVEKVKSFLLKVGQ